MNAIEGAIVDPIDHQPLREEVCPTCSSEPTQGQLDRIEAKLDKVLLFASEMNKVVEGLTPIIADIEQKGIGSIFTMLMGGKKR